MVEHGWNLPWTREVCSKDPKEVQNDGLQGHDLALNINLLSDDSLEMVDATMYC